ncbi:MAG: hypothetical protein HZC55_03740 [Verrucomicrobia bacterium]|nr:hypothetical protein [Verrucomicrobiota bacterium]
MNRRSLFLIAALCLGVAVWFLWPSREDGTDETAPTVAAPPLPRLPGQVAVPSATSALPPLETSDQARDLNSPASDIHADLRILHSCLDTYRSNFPRDGNPVGSNAEITAALTGRNRLRFAVIPPSHPALNREGELCDRWGTPFFFHAESATRMEIRSAGPDRRPWTSDDVVLSP